MKRRLFRTIISVFCISSILITCFFSVNVLAVEGDNIDDRDVETEDAEIGIVQNDVEESDEIAFVTAGAGTVDDPWDIGKEGGKVFAKVEAGTMTITGTGATKDFNLLDRRPWESIKGDVTKVVVEEGITGLGNYLFYGFYRMSNLSLPTSLKTIGSCTFSNTQALKSIRFPDSLTTIGEGAFESSGLKTLEIPDSVTSLGQSVFRNCRNLRSIILPENMTSIPNLCFCGCTAVEEMNIPSSVTKIGGGVFNEFGAARVDIRYDGSLQQYDKIDIVPSYVSGFSFALLYNDCLEKAYIHFAIRSRDDLQYLFEKIASGIDCANYVFSLANSIDLDGAELSEYWPDNKREQAFNGHFDGTGHTILNFNIHENNHRVGFFRTLGDGAVVENLILENATVVCTGSYSNCGILAGLTQGNVTVSNCTISNGTVEGSQYVAGLIGCVKSGEITIENCVNHAAVTAHAEDAAGILAHYTSDASLHIVGGWNDGNVTAEKGFAGGIVGYLGNDTKSQAHIVSNCINGGSIESVNGTAGGIIGGLCSNNQKHVVSDNTNEGNVSASQNAGGVVGWMEGGGQFQNNKNDGEIISNSANAGGIVGAVEDDSCTFDQNSNTYSVSAAKRAGGIVGYVGDADHDKQMIFTSNDNSGFIIAGSDAGGIAGGICTDNTQHEFRDCTNSGMIYASNNLGGICGWMKGGGLFSDLTNTGEIMCREKDKGTLGGICGQVEDDPVLFENCTNTGHFTDGKRRAPICGYDGNLKQGVGSTFGSGNITIIIVAAAVIVIATAAAVFIVNSRKKKKQGNAQ